VHSWGETIIHLRYRDGTKQTTSPLAKCDDAMIHWSNFLQNHPKSEAQKEAPCKIQSTPMDWATSILAIIWFENLAAFNAKERGSLKPYAPGSHLDQRH
jgi:hypothetical protein